jgi:predicted nucleotidyltransferase
VRAEDLITRMRPIIEGRRGVAAAWLFGSAARNVMRADSDVDVGIVFDAHLIPPMRSALLADLASRLESATVPHPVDIVALDEQGPVFVHHALRDGKRIVVNDEERRVDFESDALVRYFDFKPTWDLAAREQPEGMRRWLARGARP